MADPIDALVLDLLEWIGLQARPYAEVMAAWKTSCPRLPVWEQANARGFLAHGGAAGGGATVAVSATGLAWLRARRPSAASLP